MIAITDLYTKDSTSGSWTLGEIFALYREAFKKYKDTSLTFSDEFNTVTILSTGSVASFTRGFKQPS